MSATESEPLPAHPREADVIAAFRGGAPQTRARVAQATGLGRTTVSAIVARLVDEGAVEIVGFEDHRGRGRPTEQLVVRRDAVRAIGIDLTHGAARAVAMGPLGETLAQAERTHPAGVDWAARERMVRELLDELALPERLPALRGIGLGISGPAALADHGSPTHREGRGPWQGIEGLLRERFAVPVRVDNTTRFAAYAEHASAPASDRVTLHVRCFHGVGGAVVRDGELELGAHGLAGEIGHLPVEDPGEPCRCGRRGCLETVASIPAVLRHAAASTHSDETSDALAALMRGPGLDDEARDRVATALGRAIVLACSLVDPDRVILAGDLLEADPELLPGVRRAVESARGAAFPVIPVELGRLGCRAGALGAALSFTSTPSSARCPHAARR